MSFWREVFSDDKDRGSSQRVFNGIGVLVGAIIVLFQAFTNTLGEGIFAIFVLATGGVYGLGQYRQSQVEIEKVKAESPHPQPVPIPVPVPPPAVNIQVGEGKPDDPTQRVKNVDIQAESVNVESNQ